MSFFECRELKNIPTEILRPEVILSRENVVFCHPPFLSSSISHFFKNAINSKPLGVRG